jgi:transcriptional regulator with XRE-family HTH domain
MELNEKQMKVVTLRKKYNLTFVKMAEITGIKPNTLQQYTIGRRTPSDAVLFMVEEKIAEWAKRK